VSEPEQTSGQASTMVPLSSEIAAGLRSACREKKACPCCGTKVVHLIRHLKGKHNLTEKKSRSLVQVHGLRKRGSSDLRWMVNQNTKIITNIKD